MIAALPFWLELTIGVAAAITAVAAAAKVLAGAWTRSVQEAVLPLLAELQPNGGSSLRDAVDRIDVRLRALEAHIKEDPS